PAAPARPPPPAGPPRPGRPGDPGRPAPPRRPATPGQPAIPGQRTTPHDAPAAGQPGLSPARREQAADAEWPSHFAQVLAETLAGARPPGQIVPWTTDQARKRIRQLGPMLAGGGQPRGRRGG